MVTDAKETAESKVRKANPINIRGIDHVVLRVADMDAMLAFYCDVLGCKVERVLEELRLYQLRAGESLIDLVDAHGPLGQHKGAAPDRAAPNMDHVCLRVDPWDAQAVRAHLGAHGIEAGEVASRYGATGPGPSLYIDDPEGNTVELKGVT